MFTNFVPVAGFPTFDSQADVREILINTNWPVHNVQGYGARGDGVTDDTAAIRAAIAAATAAGGGGVVVFPGGPTTVYLLGPSAATYSLALGSSLALVGDGAVLRRKSGNVEILLGAASALTDLTIRGLTLDGQDAGSTAPTILSLPNGSSRVALERVRVVGILRAAAVAVAAGPVQSSDVRFVDCTFERTLGDSTAALENVNTLEVYDTSRLAIERCRFDNCGGVRLQANTAAACTAAAPMQDVRVVGCTFTRIKTTCVFVEAVASCFLANVRCERNSFLTIGKNLEKGAFSIGTNGTTAGVVVAGNEIRDWGYSGSGAAGGATPNAAQAIAVAAATGVVIEGNVLDARTPAGASPSANIGILVNGIADLVIRGNTISYCGWSGIRLRGTNGAAIARFTVAGNTVYRCAQSYDATEIPGGITVVDYTSDGSIVGNVCLNNGAGAATQAAGIGLATPTASSIADVLIADNACYDTGAGGGGKFQQYGVRVGFTGGAAASQPVRVHLLGNNVGNVDVAGGNAVAGLFYQTTVDLGYVVANNPGADGWLAYAPTLTGFSANPTGIVSRYRQEGRIVTWQVTMPANGTSSGAGSAFTLTLPVAARATASGIAFGLGVDNGVAVGPVRVDITSTTVATLYTTMAAGLWAVGNKSANFTLVYESAT